MDIVDALTAHHAMLRQLCQQAETDEALFEQLNRELTVHHTMEEKYFYDFLQLKAQARKDALEAVNEHHIIEMLLHDVDGFPRAEERFPIKVESLGEYTSHHLDEEEQFIFPMARTLFTPDELLALGAMFLEAKQLLLGVRLPDPAGIGGAAASRAGVSAPSVFAAAAPAGGNGKEPATSQPAQAFGDLGIGSLKATSR